MLPGTGEIKRLSRVSRPRGNAIRPCWKFPRDFGGSWGVRNKAAFARVTTIYGNMALLIINNILCAKTPFAPPKRFLWVLSLSVKESTAPQDRNIAILKFLYRFFVGKLPQNDTSAVCYGFILQRRAGGVAPYNVRPFCVLCRGRRPRRPYVCFFDSLRGGLPSAPVVAI